MFIFAKVLQIIFCTAYQVLCVMFYSQRLIRFSGCVVRLLFGR